MNERIEKESIVNRPKAPQAADLSGAGLRGAALGRANLATAILRDADLRGSDLRGANLRKACLSGANLKRANLAGSNLGMSDLGYACLENANLRRANLYQANLLGARLVGACLDQVDLAGAILPDGTKYTEETDLERFTDEENLAFSSTLATVKAMTDGGNSAKERESGGDESDLSWAQFVERTYGSLADDPIEWNPPQYIDSEDKPE